MITVTDLFFSYGARTVLDEISCTVSDGKLTALLGKNGAGKSTLFRCILGILAPSKGVICIDGADAAQLSPMQLARRIAYIPQKSYPSFNYSVLDMVLMGTTNQTGTIRGPRAAQKTVAMDALQCLGVADLAPRGYRYLSGGEQQLVLIARAIAQQTRTFLMDEPTSGLDYGNQIRVMEQARRLAKEGYTILLSTHNPQHALSYCDDMIALCDGKVTATGTPKTAMTGALIQRLYGVDAQFVDSAYGRLIAVEAK